MVIKGDATHVQRDCNASKNMCKQMSGKGNQSKSWSMSEPSISGEGKGKENQGETKKCQRVMRKQNVGNGTC